MKSVVGEKPVLTKGRITVDLERGSVSYSDGASDQEHQQEHQIDTALGFELISRAWLRSGWDNKQVYSFTWLGRPIIQLPEDIVRLQELVYRVKPDVLVETGIAHGGSAVLFASIFKALGKGKVVAVDIEIRSHNKTAIMEHPLYPLITLIEGDAIAPAVVDKVKAEIKPQDSVMVVLDSCHTKEHVQNELKLYSQLVTPGSYIVVMDGIMSELAGASRTKDDWTWNNPLTAAEEFVAANPAFVFEEPEFLFNEGSVKQRITYSPRGILKRVR